MVQVVEDTGKIPKSLDELVSSSMEENKVIIIMKDMVCEKNGTEGKQVSNS